MREAKQGGHFLVEKTFSGAVGLEPFAVYDELGNGALSGAADDFLSGAGSGFDVDLLIGDLVVVEEALGNAAVGAPEGRVEGDLHAWVLMPGDYKLWPGILVFNRLGIWVLVVPPRFASRDSPGLSPLWLVPYVIGYVTFYSCCITSSTRTLLPFSTVTTLWMGW